MAEDPLKQSAGRVRKQRVSGPLERTYRFWAAIRTGERFQTVLRLQPRDANPLRTARNIMQ